MCQTLNLGYNILAKWNYKWLTVEHLYHFLNKNITISTEECRANDIFVPASITTGCT